MSNFPPPQKKINTVEVGRDLLRVAEVAESGRLTRLGKEDRERFLDMRVTWDKARKKRGSLPGKEDSGGWRPP